MAARKRVVGRDRAPNVPAIRPLRPSDRKHPGARREAANRAPRSPPHLLRARRPDDFDVSQINWQPDYAPFFYRELAKCARRIYLFRSEYIFDLEHAIVVEVPQPGHATYVFAKPDDLSVFLAVYAGTTKEDIRKNCDNVAGRLRFLGRVVHGNNPQRWLKDLCERIG